MRPRCLALLLLAACAGPQPCTRTLCVVKLDGTIETSAWSGTVISTADSPHPPVPTDAEVRVKYGSAEFRNGRSRIAASEGAAFRFTVSTRAVAVIDVSNGPVTVIVSSGSAPVEILPGTSFTLPKPR